MSIDGLYEIVEMEIWDKDSSEFAERARISIQGNKGKLHFIGFDGQMDIKQTKDRYIFTWVGNNDTDPVSGYGNFTCVGNILNGRIFMHDSQDSSFIARKTDHVNKQIRMLDRCQLIVKAKEPFREWVSRLPGKSRITIRDINNLCTAYLIPKFEDDIQRDDILNTVYADIFDEQLFSWCIDDARWPRNRTLALFDRWFELEFILKVEDMV